MAFTTFDRLANQKIISGMFRGWYISTARADFGIRDSVMLVHHLNDEPHFRVRMVHVVYVRDEQESEMGLSLRHADMCFDDCA